jgi:hypothetical protein
MKKQKRLLTDKQKMYVFHAMRFYDAIMSEAVLPGGTYHYDREGNCYFPGYKHYPSLKM